MASLLKEVPSVSALLSLYASFSAFTMLFRTILKELVPKRIRDYIAANLLEFFSSYFQPNFTFIIEQRWDYVENQTFRAAEVYLPTRLTGLSTGKLLVGSSNLRNPTAEPKLGIPIDTKIVDEFEGIRLVWTLHSVESKKYLPEKRYFHVTCKKEFREKIMREYFMDIAKKAEEIFNKRENLKIYTYNQDRSRWESTIFEHHSTFKTMAIEPELKKSLIEDLEAFKHGKDFFESVGRAWKRGYLLYGPPGTGKSSLVAAIANHMKYHIYDLQIQSVKDDAELRHILTSTKNRSILLIEDIDCSKKASQDKIPDDDGAGDEKKKSRKHKERNLDIGVSLSGLLNFVDGLWSSCGEERIIILTTNHKEKLDEALLRPGRIDFPIHMGYCTPFVFKKLALSYLRIEHHSLFGSIEELIQNVETTPAEVAQQIMTSKDPDVALQNLIEYLETKKKTATEETNQEGEVKSEEEDADQECEGKSEEKADQEDEIKSEEEKTHQECEYKSEEEKTHQECECKSKEEKTSKAGTRCVQP